MLLPATLAVAQEQAASRDIHPAAIVQNPAWTSLGPAPIVSDTSQNYGNVTGRVTAIAVDPNDTTGNTVYVGGATGGVWKSVNAADLTPSNVTWLPLTDSQAALTVGAISVRPGDSNLVLVGTGDPQTAIFDYYGLGILRSTNGGAGWTLIRQTSDAIPAGLSGLAFSKIVWKPDASVVVAGTTITNQGFLNFLFPSPGILYSTDQGITWRTATFQDPGGPIPANMVSPAFDVVWSDAAQKFYAILQYHGVYSSTNGASWTRLTNQPGGTVLNTTDCPPFTSIACPIERGALAAPPGSAHELYAWFIDIPFHQYADLGIHKSIDDGANWTPLNETGITICGDLQGCGADQGFNNLYLSGVPAAGGTTDLYAGAENLFKCSINNSNPTCGTNGFINLTHVFGCSPLGATAHMHPAQHAMDFNHSNASLIFWGNDGGLYRTTNGPGMTVGACNGGTNPVDNLNAGLGSLTQFRGFAQHPTNPLILLGGIQGSGSVATDGSQGMTWHMVNVGSYAVPNPIFTPANLAGDGALSQINPSNPNEFFTTAQDVSIQRCNAGTACTASQFTTVLKSGVNFDDHGFFYVPFLLEPRDPSKMIVATCRVWRGNTDGTGWGLGNEANLLSFNFDFNQDPGFPTPCYGNESNQITALTAGGPAGPTGLSEVIYAGTSHGGLFVTTNASGGPTTWVDQSVHISGLGFQISAIALDPTDATGRTAYVTLLGFTTSQGGGTHVLKTTNAGVNWTDISISLPDAPVNAVMLDPVDHTIVYVGTDRGVYATNDNGATWQHYGTGLPNAIVTQVKTFNSGGVRRLRAATYGRGIWQTTLASEPPPDYTITLSASFFFAFPGGPVTITGKLYAVNGYNYPVTLSCLGAQKPSNCTGPAVTPSAAGTDFTVTATAQAIVAAYPFSIQGTGSDPTTKIKLASGSLQVVDFSISIAPNPAVVTVTQGNTSTREVFTLTSQGAFNGIVNFSCNPATVPAGVSCLALPASVNPTPLASKVAVVRFATTPATVVGTYMITVKIDSPGLPSPRTQVITLNVTSPDPTQADLAVTTFNHSITPDPIMVGKPIALRAIVSNLSATNTATAVTVTFTLTNNVFLMNKPGNCDGGGSGPYVCSLSTLAPNATSIVDLVLGAKFTRIVTGSVTVTSDTTDPNTVNNTPSADNVRVRPRPQWRPGLP